MLDWYIGDEGVSLIHINNGIKESTHKYQNCNTIQLMIFGVYIKMRESLYTQVIIWVNTILNHIDTMAISPRYEVSCMVYRPNGIKHTLLVLKNVRTSS